MGLAEWWSERRQMAAADEHVETVEAWDDAVLALRSEIDLVANWRGESLLSDSGFILKGSETAYLMLQGCALVEAKRLPGQWKGRSQGVSLRIMSGVYYRVGGSRGTFAPGEEALSPIDTGDVLITNERAVFAGSMQSREWDFDKVLAYRHDAATPVTYIQVSNRQKVSGFAYDREHQDDIRLRVDLALADHAGSRDQLLLRLRRELQTLESRRPAPQEPGWYPDPDGTGQRYWSGTAWTGDSAP